MSRFAVNATMATHPEGPRRFELVMWCIEASRHCVLPFGREFAPRFKCSEAAADRQYRSLA
jgi:hypothetical protein